MTYKDLIDGLAMQRGITNPDQIETEIKGFVDPVILPHALHLEQGQFMAADDDITDQMIFSLIDA